MRQVILDTGPLVAFFNPHDQHHAWALAQTRHMAAPFVTCEAVLTEAYHLLGRVPFARDALRQWMRLERVTVPYRFDEHAEAVVRLLGQYADQPMDMADACVVCLAEQRGWPVFTTDVRDFSIYRMHGRTAIPLIAPA